jgi:fermentation-respiration switch protein FrsA (DUF1100 family)
LDAFVTRGRRQPNFVRFLIIIPIVAAVAVAALYFAAQSALYYPLRYPEGWWDQQHAVGAKEIWVTTADGVRLNGWWIAAPDSAVATVYLHGNGGNLTHRVRHMRAIPAAGSSLLIVDYRGYGKSGGQPSESGLYADADAAYAWLTGQGFGAERIVIHGESLGSAVAVDLAARRPCAGVVLEAPFNSAARVAAGVVPVLGPLVMRAFDSKRKIGAIRAPLLFIHGDRDQVIPHALGQDLFDAAREPKTLWTVAGAGHSDLVDVAGAQYRERLADFYRTLPSRARPAE